MLHLFDLVTDYQILPCIFISTYAVFLNVNAALMKTVKTFAFDPMFSNPSDNTLQNCYLRSSFELVTTLPDHSK